MNSTSSSSSSSAAEDGRPPIYKVIGLILAISSGLFIGTSFVLKKVGLLKANVKYNQEAGEGYGYLKNAWWWSGMILMIIGEICNFVAYAFTDAILVTPLGALSVVVTTILSAIFLKERLSFVGKVGCFMCILGSIVIVINVPAQSSVANIQQMQNYVISPGFLSYAGVIIVGCAFIAFWAGPRYGKKSMLVYISICSLIGGLSVVATQGLGAAVVKQASGVAQFNQWFLYVLLVFVVATLLTEIVFLNKALNIFNAAVVTPTYYVYFTSSTIVSSAILFRGFHGSGYQIATVVMGFLQICSGVVLLQLSKSAKDVPDTAVFKGDLDQVHTIAEQEEHESEPKADAIRGTAAILRSFSTARQKKEAEEVKRIYDERMEPIGENELVEWDGLRRRKTIVEPGESPMVRRKSVHPPLGLTHFPDEGESETDDDQHHGLFPNLRRRALSAISARGSIGRGNNSDRTNSFPVDLSQKAPRPHTVALTDLPSNDPPYRGDDIGPLDRGLSVQEDTSYHPPRHTSAVQWSDNDSTRSSQRPPRTENRTTSSSSSIPPPTPPPHAARRQFSFQRVFQRQRTSSSGLVPQVDEAPLPEAEDEDAEDEQTPQRPPKAVSKWRGKDAAAGGSSGGGKSGVRGDSTTEEERLGLVKGDSAVMSGGGTTRGTAGDQGRAARYSSSSSSWMGEDDEKDLK